MFIDLAKVFLPLVLSFLMGIALTPSFSSVMYKYRLWKRSARGDQRSNPEISDEFSAIHNSVAETSTPRVGGVIIWFSVCVVAITIWILSKVFPTELLVKLDFLSRSQTWLPLFGLVVASVIGLGDDLLQIFGHGKKIVDGLTRWQRILIVMGIGLIGGWWFVAQLGVTSVFVPFIGSIELGQWFIVFFILVIIATFSGGIIDGIDGLAAGTLVPAFAAYAVIAFFQNQIDLAALSATITGATLAFLWFNIPPARFYLGETGTMGLTVTLAIIAFFTDQVLVLPIIALPLVVSSGSAIIQKLSKRLRNGKGVFRIAPLHHHFQSMGWSSEKITMRYWVIAVICSVAGIIIALIG